MIVRQAFQRQRTCTHWPDQIELAILYKPMREVCPGDVFLFEEIIGAFLDRNPILQQRNRPELRLPAFPSFQSRVFSARSSGFV